MRRVTYHKRTHSDCRHWRQPVPGCRPSEPPGFHVRVRLPLVTFFGSHGQREGLMSCKANTMLFEMRAKPAVTSPHGNAEVRLQMVSLTSWSGGGYDSNRYRDKVALFAIIFYRVHAEPLVPMLDPMPDNASFGSVSYPKIFPSLTRLDIPVLSTFLTYGSNSTPTCARPSSPTYSPKLYVLSPYC